MLCEGRSRRRDEQTGWFSKWLHFYHANTPFELNCCDPGWWRYQLNSDDANRASGNLFLSAWSDHWYVPGVTDFKAVKGSSTSEERNQGLEPSLFLILAVFGAAIVLTASTLCIFITFRRKVYSALSDDRTLILQPVHAPNGIEMELWAIKFVSPLSTPSSPSWLLFTCSLSNLPMTGKRFLLRQTSSCTKWNSALESAASYNWKHLSFKLFHQRRSEIKQKMSLFKLFKYISNLPPQRLRTSRDNVGGRCIQEQTDLQQRQYGSNPDLIPVKHCKYLSSSFTSSTFENEI